MEPIRLTKTVQKGGCAAKVAATELRKILSEVQFPKPDSRVLVDGRHFDDAAIYKISDDTALVQTLDFFTPIVDSPRVFGRIAAANALSDVYAMGGTPVTAMAILAFPIATLPSAVVTEVLQGAADTVGLSGANFVGGHSIDDDTLKFGLSVTGLVHPDRVWANTGAQPGDAIILTKPLGTGTLTAALKRDLITEAGISEALQSMSRLNQISTFLSDDQLRAIHSATDITGFGLSGHAYQLAKASGVKLILSFGRLPKFAEAEKFLKDEILTKAHRTNREYTESAIRWAFPYEAWQQHLINDPQTSGGLLLSVEEKFASAIVQNLAAPFPQSAIIGHVEECESENERLVFQRS